jgi:hypothetical protein
MKKCPQCEAAYFDEMIEFCLEDGTKLIVVSNPTMIDTKPFITDQKSIETVFFDASAEVAPKTVELPRSKTEIQPTAAVTEQPLSLRQKTVQKGYRALEVGTVIFALAHNWWQWVYIDRQSYGSIGNFLFSANFSVWFLLLAAGTTSGIFSLKLSGKKDLAYTGLIILAINFLLLLVPRK